MSELPLHGVEETLLDPEPESATKGLAKALEQADGAGLRAVVAAHPAFLDGWALLAEQALDAGDPGRGLRVRPDRLPPGPGPHPQSRLGRQRPRPLVS